MFFIVVYPAAPFLGDETRKKRYDDLLRSGNTSAYENYCSETYGDFMEEMVKKYEIDLKEATKSGIYPAPSLFGYRMTFVNNLGQTAKSIILLAILSLFLRAILHLYLIYQMKIL